MSGPDQSREEALARLNERADALETRNVKPVRDYGAAAVNQGYQLLGQLIGGVLDPQTAPVVFRRVCQRITPLGLKVLQVIESPIRGQKGNVEFLAMLRGEKEEREPRMYTDKHGWEGFDVNR